MDQPHQIIEHEDTLERKCRIRIIKPDLLGYSEYWSNIPPVSYQPTDLESFAEEMADILGLKLGNPIHSRDEKSLNGCTSRKTSFDNKESLSYFRHSLLNGTELTDIGRNYSDTTSVTCDPKVELMDLKLDGRMVTLERRQLDQTGKEKIGMSIQGKNRDYHLEFDSLEKAMCSLRISINQYIFSQTGVLWIEDPMREAEMIRKSLEPNKGPYAKKD